MALASALEASSHDLNLVAPCDVPDLPADLIARLVREARDADAAVPVTQDGHLEPLLAVYRKAMAPAARAALERGERKVVSMYGSCRIRRIPLDGGVELRNLNTMADYLACCGSRCCRHERGPGGPSRPAGGLHHGQARAQPVNSAGFGECGAGATGRATWGRGAPRSGPRRSS